jgi:hypothetical protein
MCEAFHYSTFTNITYIHIYIYSRERITALFEDPVADPLLNALIHSVRLLQLANIQLWMNHAGLAAGTLGMDLCMCVCVCVYVYIYICMRVRIYYTLHSTTPTAGMAAVGTQGLDIDKLITFARRPLKTNVILMSVSDVGGATGKADADKIKLFESKEGLSKLIGDDIIGDALQTPDSAFGRYWTQVCVCVCVYVCNTYGSNVIYV